MSMLKAELGKVKQSRLLMITLIVVMLIPSIYSTIFLKSMWDTYERMDSFPVAVVNHDKPAEKLGKEVNIGSELVKTLEKSNDMDFQSTTAEKAKKGLDDGKYYMAITVPETFSEDSLTVMDKKPKQMNLTYETSAGHNFTSSKFSQIAAGRVMNEVQNKVTRTYAETVLGQIKNAGGGLEQAGDGALTLASGLGQLGAGSTKLEDGAGQLNNGLGQLLNGVGAYTAGVGTAAAGSQKLADGGVKLESGVTQYTNGVNQAAAGAPVLINGINLYTNGVDHAAASSPALSAGIKQYTDGVKLAADNAPDLSAGIKQYTDGAKTAATGAQTVSNGIDQYIAGVKKAKTGTQKVADGAAKMKAATHSDDVKKLEAGMKAMNGAVSGLKNSGNDETPAEKAIKANMTSLATQIATMSKLMQSPNLSNEERASLGASLKQSQTDLQNLQETLKAQKAGVTKQVGELAAGYGALNDGMSKYIAQTQQGSSDLADGAAQVNGGIDQLTGDKATKLSNGAAELAGGLAQLSGKSGKLQGGAAELAGGLAQLSGNNGELQGGVAQLVNGLQQLSGKSGELQGGATQLAGGLAQLSDKSGELQNGAAQAIGGINQLNGGLATLSSKSGTLQSAVGQLNAGSSQLANGAGQLSVGLVKANDGAEELGSKLSEGADKIKQVRNDNDNLNMFASPIKETHEDRTRVKNNGTGMAPYMISIYIFVGMITLMAVMHLTEPASYPTSSLSWWLSKYTVPFVLVFVGAIITAIVSVTLIGLEPVNMGGFILSLIVISIMDMSIVYFFTAAFGKIGTFLSLILMVLQLSASGGTYPIQLSSGFFQWLHPLLPMTYAIQALRGSLSTGLSITQPIMTMLAIFVAFSLLSWAYFAIQFAKRYRFRDTNELDEKSAN